MLNVFLLKIIHTIYGTTCVTNYISILLITYNKVGNGFRSHTYYQISQVKGFNRYHQFVFYVAYNGFTENKYAIHTVQNTFILIQSLHLFSIVCSLSCEKERRFTYFTLELFMFTFDHIQASIHVARNETLCLCY